ncbi:MAG TPA: hypothetical protein VJW51_02280 [Candidatus Acidoferrales bacterium]|nr:hypothetical protein [Candidatus Acidoferrales bacterium]
MRFLLTYVAGPVAAFLPERWRNALPMADCVKWERAGALSGLLEFAGATVGMAFWYMHAVVAQMIGTGVESALLGKFGVEVTEHQIGGAALVLFALHPLTWMLAYAFGEGAMRFAGAAFIEDVRGTFPLYVVERALYLARHPDEAGEMAEEARRNVKATVEILRERAMVARLREVPDELKTTTEAAEEFLEISACRRKEDWEAPKIVRVDEAYYRLEASSVEKGTARPFRYRLRRLEAGVPGRGVLVYKTGKMVVKQ